MTDARLLSLARLAEALSRGRHPRPLPRRKPPSAGAVPVVSPRTPTLSGGAAARVGD